MWLTKAESPYSQQLYDRFVGQKLGGYCMQTNKLLLDMLLCLGYKAFAAPGRICRPASALGQSPSWGGFSHLVVLVLLPCHLDASKQAIYLVDVGFGARGIVRPHIVQEGHQEKGRGACVHRYIRAPMLTSSFDQNAAAQPSLLPSDLLDAQRAWQDNYSFITTQVFPADIKGMSFFSSSHPDSIFQRTIMVVKYSLELQKD